MTAVRRPTAADGVLVVDKPAGWTSHDVVGRVRRLAATRKVGHAGTLDPMATGVLVVGVGRATRLLAYLSGADKAYRATIRLGVGTVTDDAEGEALTSADASGVTRDAIEAGVRALTGDIRQVPAAVSAIKVDGQRAYARVRAGQDVHLAARPVTVSRFDVLAVRPVEPGAHPTGSGVPPAELGDSAAGDVAPGADGAPVVPTVPVAGPAVGSLPMLDVDVEVVCSSGTYVRALARDLGAALGVGGHLTALRRTRVGGFGLDVARTLDALADEPDDRPLPVLPLADAARATFPVRPLSDAEARDLGHGKFIGIGKFIGTGVVAGGDGPVEAAAGDAGTLAAIGPDGALVALVEPRAGMLAPVVVFAPA